MGFLSSIASATGIGQILGIESDAEKAAKQAASIQQQEAITQAGDINTAGAESIARFDPLAAVGQQGIAGAGFLGDPAQQASFLQGNPLFQLGLDNLNQQTNRSAASQGRLTAGDTLSQLQNNAQLAGQPLIDRQRQDILGLLGIAQNTAGAQANMQGNTAASVADLLTGGAAAQAAGVVGAANAQQQATGNLIDIAGLFGGFGGFGGGGGGGISSPPPSATNFINNQNTAGSGFTGFGV